MRAVAYTRVSTSEQADSGAGLDVQIAAIELDCRRRDATIVERFEDAGFSAKNLKRPGIQQALDLLGTGRADALVVAKLDRLSRSLLDFAALMERARREGWALVALDLGVDTTTPSGEMMANVLATFAQFERRLIGQRTKDALAIKRAQGVKLGRPRAVPGEIIDQIVAMRASGTTFAAIATQLNECQVPTGHGGACWHASTVHALLRTLA
jgi:DNA invertase Pin-like site-specific DNA recombinase